ncbi:MAG: phosphate signaling complex protein PhoU [Xanthomonadales bacterium]|nr:phosphate signaling complex protein PhoU [Xanthomonadales bacterium]
MTDLHLGQHISRQFNEELEDVRSKVLYMGGLVEEQLANALKVLVNDEVELARDVINADSAVNSLEVDIDEECTRIVARRQPAATDLRLVMTVSKTINDLERIGDEAKRVAKMSRKDMDGALRDDVRTDLEFMGSLVRDMLRQVLDAFARTDVDTAILVVKSDKKVDKRYKKVVKKLIKQMGKDPDTIPGTLNIMWAARSLERLADRCQNIAEHVIYMVLGMDVRHIRLDDILAEIEAQSELEQEE